MIKINYDHVTDETKIEFSDEFNALPLEQQLDAMQEARELLDSNINKLLLDSGEYMINWHRLEVRKQNKAAKEYVKDMWGN